MLKQVLLTVAGDGQNRPLSTVPDPQTALKFSKEDRVGPLDFSGQVMPKKI